MGKTHPLEGGSFPEVLDSGPFAIIPPIGRITCHTFCVIICATCLSFFSPFTFLCSRLSPPAPALPYQAGLISPAKINIVSDKAGWKRDGRAPFVTDQRKWCQSTGTHGDFQFAYYRTGTTSVRVRTREARELGIRGSTIIIAGRGAPIKKSISPFLGCDDPLGEREMKESLIPMRKNEESKWYLERPISAKFPFINSDFRYFRCTC